MSKLAEPEKKLKRLEKDAWSMIMEKQLEVVYTPYTKLIIHEIYFMSLEELKLMVKIHGQPYLINRPMTYCDGWLILPEPFPANNEIINERTRGVLRWGGVNVCYIGKFKPVLEVEQVKIPLVDQQKNPIIKKFVEWLEKTYYETETTQA